MRLFHFVLATLFLSTIVHATELEIVENIISMNQEDARRILGREIAYTVFETNQQPNANASYRGPNNGPLLTYYSSLLMDQSDDDVVPVVCHELGHLLGNRASGVTPSGNAIEEEADYFAGKCSVKYYRTYRGMSLRQAQNATAAAAMKAFQELFKTRLNPDRARSEQFPSGINQTYADPDCRILTIINGSMDWKRPTCWYNP